MVLLRSSSAATAGCRGERRASTAETFAGSSDELARLLDSLSAPPKVVRVEGEAGIGKSELVRQALRHPRHRNRQVLTGACLPLSTPLPYGPIVDALRQVTSGTDTTTGQLKSAVAALNGPMSGRNEAFHSIRQLLGGLGQAILVVEDVHWCDQETADLLIFLTRSPPPELSVILTLRPEEISAGHPTPRVVESVAGMATTRIALGPLAPAEVREMAASLLELSAVPVGFADELHQRTAGIPRLVAELLADLRRRLGSAPPTRNELRPELLDALDPPRSLCDRLGLRVSELGPTSVAVLSAIAVLEEPATESEIATVAGLPARRVADGVVRALRAGLLHETADRRYGFRPPLARDVVYAAVPGPPRRLLHARTAELLAASSTPPELRLAQHHRQAGNFEAWARHTRTAVDLAMGAGDVASALILLEDALDDPDLPLPARNTFAVRFSCEASHGIVQAHTIERLRAVLRDERLSRATRAEVRLNLGRLLINQVGLVEAGTTEIELAIDDLQRHATLVARGLASLTMPSFGPAPVEANLRWLGEAERIARDNNDDELRMNLLANRVTVLIQRADPSVWDVVAGLWDEDASGKVRKQLTRAFVNLADGTAWNGHFQQSKDFLEKAGQLIETDEDPYLSLLTTGTRLRLDALTGNWDALGTHAREMIHTAGESHFLAAEAWLALAWVSLAHSDWPVATEQFTKAASSAGGSFPILAAADAGKTTLRLAQGAVAAAVTEAEAGIDRMRRKGNWVWAADLAPVAVQAFVRSGRIDDAVRLSEEYTAGIAGCDAPLASAAAAECQAFITARKGGADEAATHFGEVAALYAELPSLLSAARSNESAARFAAQAGNTTDAARYFTSALDTYTRLGLQRDMTRCKRTLGRFQDGERKRGRKGYGAALSPRERDVARLAAQGLTNRQIAEALFLSPRTVEQHVAKALRKLGLQTRVALAHSGASIHLNPE
ncbi:helix-turn-helix transcriptional regulator [Amycolatopsis palatopharyngis]|uniref:helix-turn-helix transcriptional regulator n=1 Tax=Amycolatopsis palatopharyngis TaxID=187982 RepID=UPI0013BEA971|nr:LuxR family transcriptional regulator [Amycolatopsis palatopharyngis]